MTKIRKNENEIGQKSHIHRHSDISPNVSIIYFDQLERFMAIGGICRIAMAFHKITAANSAITGGNPKWINTKRLRG